jgi:hypothetical protein
MHGSRQPRRGSTFTTTRALTSPDRPSIPPGCVSPAEAVRSTKRRHRPGARQGRPLRNRATCGRPSSSRSTAASSTTWSSAARKAELLPVPRTKRLLRGNQGPSVPPEGERRRREGGLQEVRRQRTGRRAPDARDDDGRRASRRAHRGDGETDRLQRDPRADGVRNRAQPRGGRKIRHVPARIVRPRRPPTRTCSSSSTPRDRPTTAAM